MTANWKRVGPRPAGNQRGFTIVELLAVLVILGLILGLVIRAIFPQLEEAKVKAAKAQIEVIGLALDNYRLDVGSYPASLEELVQSSATGWKGPYLKKKQVPADPWNNPYLYEAVDEGNDYRMSSTGGGKQEIKSWE